MYSKRVFEPKNSILLNIFGIFDEFLSFILNTILLSSEACLYFPLFDAQSVYNSSVLRMPVLYLRFFAIFRLSLDSVFCCFALYCFLRFSLSTVIPREAPSERRERSPPCIMAKPLGDIDEEKGRI